LDDQGAPSDPLVRFIVDELVATIYDLASPAVGTRMENSRRPATV